jgi:hypothetical protein
MKAAAWMVRRRRRVEAAPAEFDFASVPGLSLWYDARQQAGYADGESATEVTDFSGSAAHLTSGAVAHYTYRTAVIEGNPAFRGATDAIQLSRAAVTFPVFSANSAMTMFVLAKTDWAADVCNLFSWRPDGDNFISFAAVSGALEFKHGDAFAAAASAAGFTTGSGWHVLEAYRSGVTLEVLSDGVSGGTNSGAANLVDSLATDAMGVTTARSSAANALEGDWMVVLCWNRALSAGERTTVRTELGALAGLAL